MKKMLMVVVMMLGLVGCGTCCDCKCKCCTIQQEVEEEISIIGEPFYYDKIDVEPKEYYC